MSGETHGPDGFPKTHGVVSGLGLIALAAALCAGLGWASREHAGWVLGPASLLAADVLLTLLLLATRSQSHPVRLGIWAVLQLDLFALILLGCGWALTGGGPPVAAALATAFAAVAVLGYVLRRAVLEAFLEPTGRRPGLALAVIPLLAAGGPAQGLVLGGFLGIGPAAVTGIFAVIALYITLFAQSSILRVVELGRRPER